jgi:Domain of unknown function (DUF1844)
MAEEKEGAGFVVKDKRLFSESGETTTNEKEKSSVTEEKPQAQETTGKPEDFDFPPINFTNFVLSLSTSALFHFGDFPDPSSGTKTEKNLPAAKQTIDILDMINEKTKGNLNEQENNLIQGVLYELKLRYVKEKG